MDQAVTQPARASSAAPAPATTVAAAHINDLTSTNAATIAHAHQSTDFWADTMKASVFWNAASAAATTLAIFAAFLVPWLAERRQQKVRTSYALRMLPPVFDEAVALTNEAEAVYAICLDLKANIGRVDWNNFTSNNMVVEQQGWRPTENGVDPITVAVPTHAALDRITRFAATELPSYEENRSWLMGLKPDDAGDLQNAFSEAQLNLRKCREAVRDWPDVGIGIGQRHVEKLMGPLLRTREISNLAARRLSRLLKMPFTETVDDSE